MSRRALPADITPRLRDVCLCLHVQRAARAVARRYDEALRPLALTNWQFSLLVALNAPAPSLAAVARVLAMDRTTLLANLKPLSRRGLVAVAVDGADRRRRVPALTGPGRALLAEALPRWRRAQAATERLIARSGPERLRADLRALA